MSQSNDVRTSWFRQAQDDSFFQQLAASTASLASHRGTLTLGIMLAAELLALLVCPETRQEVGLAASSELDLLNGAIRSGRVRTVAGKEVTEPVEGALIRADHAVAYPIRDGIPVMLVAEGLMISPEIFNAGENT